MAESRRRGPLVALFAANAISMSGNVAALVAIPWFVLQTTGSASRTGITAAAAIVPVVVSGIFGGTIVDRLGYRRTSIVADLASAGAVAAIPLLDATVGIAFWQLVALVFLGGLLDTPGVTARAALLPDLAALAGWSLERASGVAAAVERASRLAGAPVAGVLIAVVGATNVLWVDAASFLVSALVIVVAIPRRPRADLGDDERPRYLDELRAGIAFLRGDRTLATLIGVVTLTNMLDAVSIVVLPVYAATVFGDALSLGLLMGVAGAGALLGALTFSAVGERLSRRNVFIWGFAVTTLWYPVAATFPPLAVLLVARLVSGFGAGPLNPVIDTVFFERIPDGLRGRVFGVSAAAAWIAMPIGVLVAGPAIEFAGLRPTLLVVGATYLTVVLAGLFLPSLRGMDRQAASAADPRRS